MSGQLAYVGLGSNLEDPLAQVRSAAEELDRLPGTRRLALSPFYRSAPLGPPGQPDYVNAVALLATTLPPHALLDELQALESRHGRVRGPQRWGPRTLDLDLLLYADQCIHDARLTLPHPGIAERAFVLVPLYDVAPELRLPDGRAVGELARQCDRAGLSPIAA